ncbi:nitroreductase family protein [Leucobacter soli]|uniref:Nitroreductase domain-containing protein n=1 Tax=Leucobacter soli TaxID=2812850 RepID=A0A916JY31_9MICO|nr:nitroreductase family protein [Leucobacter soli]CAG7606483.1 hypothetical protein LEUCIP111803_00935 [Leucobacter soli]
MTPRTATTSAPVLDSIATRWSPRAFDADHSLPEGALRGVFEAARWSASASNTQPWRFIIARRGSESFAKIEAALMGFNQAWAGTATALVVNVAETLDVEGDEQPWAAYDLGQAVASYSLQARSEGLYVHQMGGFDRQAIRDSFELSAGQEPISVAAIGLLGDTDQLPDALRERELAPRSRRPLEEIVLVND